MSADLTRNSFEPLKHFSRVLQQQGRVQLDADWNEQAAIVLHLIRRLAADRYPNGGGTGFAPEAIGTAALVPGDFAIGAGSYWVDGILCESESSSVAVTKWIDGDTTIVIASWTVDGVPFARGQYVQLVDDAVEPPAPPLLTAKIVDLDYSKMTLTLDAPLPGLPQLDLAVRRLNTYLSQPALPEPPPLASVNDQQLYLDVWEQEITSAQDDSIREVALNGPDTAGRTRVVGQVRIANTNLSVSGNPPSRRAKCLTSRALERLLRPGPAGLLRARTQPTLMATDPCTIAPNARYRGPENQLYRVQIHVGTGDTGGRPPSFVWSRENGSVVYRIVSLASAGGITTVSLADLGRDDRFGLTEGDIVGVEDDRSVLGTDVPALLPVQSVDRSARTVTLRGIVNGRLGNDLSLHPILRRWDHKAGDPADGGLKIAPGGGALIETARWLNLEDGVQVQFARDGGRYYTNDFWLIPARVATGDVIWPTESWTDANQVTTISPVAKPPDGIKHHYAPLGGISADGKQNPTFSRCT